jgi:hypothetical protein
MTIFAVPDDVLLEIFDLYLNAHNWTLYRSEMDAWHTLVHVCQTLNLRLLCNTSRSIMKMLDIWPHFPIIINEGHVRLRISDVTNITAALGQHNRVCKINLGDTPSWALETISAAVEELFPALTHLWLDSEDKNPGVLGNSFLGGSAPSLRCIRLNGIPFLALPHLLLSTHDLVVLHLENIPQSGYISPKAMVAGLSALNKQHLSL